MQLTSYVYNYIVTLYSIVFIQKNIHWKLYCDV